MPSNVLKLTPSPENCQNFVFVGQLVGLATEPTLSFFLSLSLSLSLSPLFSSCVTPSSLLFSVLCDNKKLYRSNVYIFMFEFHKLNYSDIRYLYTRAVYVILFYDEMYINKMSLMRLLILC